MKKRQHKVRLFERKAEPSHVDPFLLDEHHGKYVEAFKGLPRVDSIRSAMLAINKLKRLHKRFSQDKGGLRHVHLLAEIGEHQALLKGKPDVSRLYTEFLNEFHQKQQVKRK